jgi:hypothetical protein
MRISPLPACMSLGTLGALPVVHHVLPQNLILECGFTENIDLIFVVNDVIHYPVPVILNISLHYLIGEGILGFLHQGNGLPVC